MLKGSRQMTNLKIYLNRFNTISVLDCKQYLVVLLVYAGTKTCFSLFSASMALILFCWTYRSVVFHMKKYSMMFRIDFQGRKSFRMSLKSLPYFSMASSNRLASEADQSSISSRQSIGPLVGTKARIVSAYNIYFLTLTTIS